VRRRKDPWKGTRARARALTKRNLGPGRAKIRGDAEKKGTPGETKKETRDGYKLEGRRGITGTS